MKNKKIKPKNCEYCGKITKKLTYEKSAMYNNSYFWSCSLQCSVDFDSIEK